MKGTVALGLAAGILIGGAAVIVLLPQPRARLREVGARLASIDGLGARAEQLERIGRQALDAARARYRIALAEAQQAREEAERELWARLAEAKRLGRLPPG